MEVELPKIVKVRSLVRALNKMGFVEAGGTKHYKLKDYNGRIATITRSHSEIPRSMLNMIVRKEIGMTEEEVKRLIALL